MKIVFVIESFGAGVLNAVAMIANTLAEHHDVSVVHDRREDTPSNYEAIFVSSVNLIYFPIRSTLLSFNFLRYKKFSELIRNLSPEVLHLHSSFAGALGRLVFFRNSEFRIFYSPHAFKFVGGSNLSRCVYFVAEWFLAKSRSIIIACSKSELDHALKLNNSALLLENAIDTSKFAAKTCKSGVSPEKIVVGSIGRIVLQKRPDVFSQIAKIILERHSNVEFRWVGSGIEEEYIKVLDIGGVRRVEQVPPNLVPRELNEIDIYVQCSDYEGMPLSVIEAQVSGLPCVVSACDGNRDVVVDGETGYIVLGIEDYVDRIERLIRDADLRAEIGSRARRVGLLRFDKTNYIEKLLYIYKYTSLQ